MKTRKQTMDILRSYFSNGGFDHTELYQIAWEHACFNLVAQSLDGANEDLSGLNFSSTEAEDELKYLESIGLKHEEMDNGVVIWTI